MRKIVSTFNMKILVGIVAISLFPMGNNVAFAASCNAKASQLASSRGGNVLSVRSMGNKCKIRLLIKSRNKPPKRVTVVVSK